jgi:hypothetical protein
LFKSLEVGLNPCSIILQSSIDTKFMWERMLSC